MAEHNIGLTAVIYVSAPLIGLSANALVQIITVRASSGTGLLTSIFIGFLAGLCMIIALDVAYAAYNPSPLLDLMSSGLANLIIYAALGYCYFHFVGLSETARRIRMLAEIAGSENGLSTEEILGRYCAREIVEKRIARLLKNGQLRQKDGRYFIGKPVVLLIARSAVMLKILFLGRRSEFDERAF